MSSWKYGVIIGDQFSPLWALWGPPPLFLARSLTSGLRLLSVSILLSLITGDCGERYIDLILPLAI